MIAPPASKSVAREAGLAALKGGAWAPRTPRHVRGLMRFSPVS
jgi:hypothetical protein